MRVRPQTIDAEGLQRCNLFALRKAIRRLDHAPDYVLLDAFRMKRLRWPGLAVKKADVISTSVAAASIVAKVARDRSMRRYHRQALKARGPCDIHRRSFFGVLGFPDEDGVLQPHGARDLTGEIAPEIEPMEESG